MGNKNKYMRRSPEGTTDEGEAEASMMFPRAFSVCPQEFRLITYLIFKNPIHPVRAPLRDRLSCRSLTSPSRMGTTRSGEFAILGLRRRSTYPTSYAAQQRNENRILSFFFYIILLTGYCIVLSSPIKY